MTFAVTESLNKDGTRVVQVTLRESNWETIPGPSFLVTKYDVYSFNSGCRIFRHGRSGDVGGRTDHRGTLRDRSPTDESNLTLDVPVSLPHRHPDPGTTPEFENGLPPPVPFPGCPSAPGDDLPTHPKDNETRSWMDINLNHRGPLKYEGGGG